MMVREAAGTDYGGCVLQELHGLHSNTDWKRSNSVLVDAADANTELSGEDAGS